MRVYLYDVYVNLLSMECTIALFFSRLFIVEFQLIASDHASCFLLVVLAYLRPWHEAKWSCPHRTSQEWLDGSFDRTNLRYLASIEPLGASSLNLMKS